MMLKEIMMYRKGSNAARKLKHKLTSVTQKSVGIIGFLLHDIEVSNVSN